MIIGRCCRGAGPLLSNSSLRPKGLGLKVSEALLNFRVWCERQEFLGIDAL